MTQRVEVTQIAQFQCRVRVPEYGLEFIGDEPDTLGGTNAGPNPWALLLASLGT